MVNEQVINGVKVTEDGDVTHFVPVENTEKHEAPKKQDAGFFGKVKDWWNGLWIKPYVKVRDLADPFGDRTDPDAGSDGKSGVEVGIRIDF